jgi:hypothetical protein
MIVAAWTAQPWWEYAFLSDDSPVSWLSSALLMGNAVVAFKLTLDAALPRWLGYAATCALLLLTVDEQFMLHERYKHMRLLQLSSSHSVLASWLGDVPIMLVALGGIAFVWLFSRASPDRAARNLLRVGVALGVFAVWVDVGHPPTWLARFEEAYEVLAESLFLSALLAVRGVHVQSSS